MANVNLAPRLKLAGVALAAALSLSACTGGYGGMSIGTGYYGDGYYDDYYGYPYSYYGPSFYDYGWYDGWYYPGNGYYVFDRSGTRRRWSDRERNYWATRPRPSQGQNPRPVTQNPNMPQPQMYQRQPRPQPEAGAPAVQQPRQEQPRQEQQFRPEPQFRDSQHLFQRGGGTAPQGDAQTDRRRR